VSTPHKLIYHLDDLFVHLIRHHKTLPIALEHGLIKSLMKILKLYPEEVYILNRAREVLAISGYNPPVKGPGISVLSIDGGGVRGLVAIEVLRQIENVTKKRIHELFDFICGVSTGSIIAFLLGAHHRTLDECEALYREFSREVFSQNSFVGAGSLMWSHAYYHTPTWEKILQKHLGKASLLSLARDPTSPRVAAISAVVSQERIAPYVFRTYAFRPEVHARYKGGSEHMMWEAVRASAAAPTYFEEMRIGNCIHQDGGILVNNPSSVALSEARGIWSGVPLQCVVSLGTGMTLSSRLEPHVGSVTTPDSKVASSLSWKGKFLKVLDSATDTESIHYTLQELLPKEVYFRFNPYVSEVVSLDEASPEKLDIIQAETRDYLQRNYERITCVGEALTKQKGITKKVTDWWNY
jgi:calcium-independent phospholipase A2-gamma